MKNINPIEFSHSLFSIKSSKALLNSKGSSNFIGLSGVQNLLWVLTEGLTCGSLLRTFPTGFVCRPYLWVLTLAGFYWGPYLRIKLWVLIKGLTCGFWLRTVPTGLSAEVFYLWVLTKGLTCGFWLGGPPLTFSLYVFQTPLYVVLEVLGRHFQKGV